MTKKPWSGRFTKETDKLVEQFTESVSFDLRLFEDDVRGSIAHAKMLGKQGIIPRQDAEAIVAGLGRLIEEYERGELAFDISLEDVHMNVEKFLRDRIGSVAGKLHTARSRNDQIALDIRLFLKREIPAARELIADLQKALIEVAERNIDALMPGFTHFQHAQPIYLGHHLMAYFWMFQRDRERLSDCLKRVDVLPLGSAAFAGTTFPIDREFVAKELGFSKVSENSMDSVSDRDFIVEFLAAAALTMAHLSRLAQDIMLWSSHEYGFVELDDSVTTGSSIMPQKKNPDCAELIRGKTGRVYGSLMTLLTILHALPMSYNRDLQEDKEPLFDALDTVKMSLQVMALMLRTAKFNSERMREAIRGDFSTATDLADALVRRGVPFREAHAIVGALVKNCIAPGKGLEDITLSDLKEVYPDADLELLGCLDPECSANARKAAGGTAKENVARQIKQAKQLMVDG